MGLLIFKNRHLDVTILLSRNIWVINYNFYYWRVVYISMIFNQNDNLKS
ncbi:hypothetical protein DAVIES_49 [Brevibacillus phage Davies]|uniref:Uncharacterized protein n=1 Tax=Brevibacillus phage Davies TaxID=1296662 RepID=S5M6E6_9CAUD|nr:hypothetical protein DAVIES_49 [Brevibacillus phage Davies]AGR47616.1 hypothetical protein DAVIES_49 [Brevibacillus phage Davies]